jgi:hypothetical protein
VVLNKGLKQFETKAIYQHPAFPVTVPMFVMYEGACNRLELPQGSDCDVFMSVEWQKGRALCLLPVVSVWHHWRSPPSTCASCILRSFRVQQWSGSAPCAPSRASGSCCPKPCRGSHAPLLPPVPLAAFPAVCCCSRRCRECLSSSAAGGVSCRAPSVACPCMCSTPSPPRL